MEDYVKKAIETDNSDIEGIIKRLSDPMTARLIHALLGMVTEVGEFADTLKKWVIYGKGLDIKNLMEEIGDQQWYQAIAVDELGYDSFHIIQKLNIAKLRARYPNKFNEQDALNRNLDKEKEIINDA